MSASTRRFWRIAATSAAIGIAVVSIALAATKAINLDSRSTNAAESAVALNILSSFPARVEDKVTNRAVGNSYTFKWPSAGPGGFTSQLQVGTTAGVGVTWVWQTAQTIYSVTGTSCANDVCFTKVSGPDPAPPIMPAWAVPGRTLVPNSVTLSTGSLTASLITFFSPPQTLVTATNSVQQLASGEFAYTTTYTNHTGDAVEITVPPAPPGCCPGGKSPQINCDGECVEYEWDDDNCGGCDINCDDVDCANIEGVGGDAYCYYGSCECGESGYAQAPPPDFTVGRRNGPTPDRPVFGAKQTVASDVIVGAHSYGNVEQAPYCQTSGFTTVIPAGGTFPDCQYGNYLPKEIPGALTVCGNLIPDGEETCPGGDPASQGTFMQFIPDLANPVPTSGAYLTPYQIAVNDTNGDGILQPGESATVFISVLNVGPDTYTDPAATLLSPPVDMTDDGVSNPAPIGIAQATSAYAPDVAGVVPAPGSDCTGPFAPGVPSTNVIAFLVTVPTDHPGDVVRPFSLAFTGLVDGQPTPWTVPISLGIGSAEADLSITKQGTPATATPGSNITYTLAVTNHGPLDAATVIVTDDIPAGTTFVSAGGSGWTCNSLPVGGTGTLSCSRPLLANSASASITLVVKVATTCPAPASITNTANVSSSTPDELTDNNAATKVITVSAPNPVVEILAPVSDQLGLPNLNYPVTIVMRSTSTSPIARETISLEGCLLWDGATYGDRDGLLTDEYMLQTNKYMLCQAMARCGYQVLYYPKIRVTGADNCGRTGTDEVIYRRNLLKTEVCAR